MQNFGTKTQGKSVTQTASAVPTAGPQCGIQQQHKQHYAELTDFQQIGGVMLSLSRSHKNTIYAAV